MFGSEQKDEEKAQASGNLVLGVRERYVVVFSVVLL